MTEQKRPVLTLKRKTEGETPTRSRKTIINVTTPPKWKVKKQKLAEKAAREAELTAKKAQARQALSIYLNLPSLDEAVNGAEGHHPFRKLSVCHESRCLPV